jgi:hypothetical protein
MKGEDERNCDANQNYDEDGDNNDDHASPPPGYPIRISPPSDTPSSHQYVVATSSIRLGRGKCGGEGGMQEGKAHERGDAHASLLSSSAKLTLLVMGLAVRRDG